MTERQVPLIALRDHREKTVALLCEHFAADRLDMQELETRLDRAQRAATLAELEGLVSDLHPGPAAGPPPPAAAARPRTGARVRDAIADSRTYGAFMSGVEKRGAWTPARRNVVIAVMGGVELDFRDVDLPPGETEVYLFCMMGGANIIVPPDVAVDTSGAIAIMGGIEHGASSRRPHPAAPVLRITGLCIMGGAEISVREAGEAGRDAKRRLRAERKLLSQKRRRPGG